MSGGAGEQIDWRMRILHGPPMHFIDAVTVEGTRATATRTIAAGHPFVRDGMLLRTALIEMLSQCAACASAPRAHEEGRKLARGMLVAARDVQFDGDARVGETVTLMSAQERTFGGLTQCVVEARVGERVLARGRLTFHVAAG